MTKETETLLDNMIIKANKNMLKPAAFYMHHNTKEDKKIPDSFKGVDVFVSGLMPIDSIYLTEQTCLWE
jgi:hypothetical protein